MTQPDEQRQRFASTARISQLVKATLNILKMTPEQYEMFTSTPSRSTKERMDGDRSCSREAARAYALNLAFLKIMCEIERAAASDMTLPQLKNALFKLSGFQGWAEAHNRAGRLMETHTFEDELNETKQATAPCMSVIYIGHEYAYFETLLNHTFDQISPVPDSLIRE